MKVIRHVAERLEAKAVDASANLCLAQSADNRSQNVEVNGIISPADGDGANSKQANRF